MIKKLSTLFCTCVIALAAVGYFAGIRDGVPTPSGLDAPSLISEVDDDEVDEVAEANTTDSDTSAAEPNASSDGAVDVEDPPAISDPHRQC